ncbi:YbaB/EbfC family nucleoid-associated protein [Nonomuraea sp. NN258]|uniref:YbaB/EbfC family nucleoid-associated protein n=1 Tax=Nonomuraea antri TaxID=2730852 RepID=UPI001C2B7E11|nr:YbaB/EbfC family nucleoid-associated protein [Nonomuraea antri]NRQ34638.1 YbaB/EbfC family nucleoid-associated protein [Nonomuraea antri]
MDLGGIGPEELERYTRAAEESLRRMAELQERLDAVRGTGTAAGGQITVGADNAGRIVSIDLNPRIMRMASEDLADELLRAVNAAQDDCARQARDLLAEIGADPSGQQLTFEAMEQELLKSHASFLKEMEGLGGM